MIQTTIGVHRILDPGLFESAYEQCLTYKLKPKVINFKLQHGLHVAYKGIKLDCGQKRDLYVPRLKEGIKRYVS
ncbi:MAG: GxxExxY protein [Desulfatiglans sp.]|nr:GxxExxY protein [Desulfatiglans sp.]